MFLVFDLALEHRASILFGEKIISNLAGSLGMTILFIFIDASYYLALELLISLSRAHLTLD